MMLLTLLLFSCCLKLWSISTTEEKWSIENKLSTDWLTRTNLIFNVQNIKTKKCQPTDSDTPDLIKTGCVTVSGLARPKKLTGQKKYKIKKDYNLAQKPVKSAKMRNKEKKAENGNISKSFKVTHWNSGSKHWKNKINEIQVILDTRRPDLLIVSEANVFNTNQDYELVTPGYVMLKTKAWDTLGHCRLVTLVRNNLQIEMVSGIYREHSVLLQEQVTDSESLQNARWKIFINQWTTANRLGDCIVLGDTNLDFLKWASPDSINTAITNMVKNGPESEGSCQLITEATRFWPNQRPSLIDQVWTNCPQRVISANNVVYGASDHNIIEVMIKFKGKIGGPKVIRKRKIKNWETDLYRKMVNDIDWSQLYESSDVHRSYGIFEEQIRSILDFLAPMFNVQFRNNYKPWVNDDLKKLMQNRDTLRETARHSGLPEDWNKYKMSRNKCNMSLKKVKTEHLKSVYRKLEVERDISSMYKVTRQQLSLKKGSTPDSFLINGNRVSSPAMMANIEMNTFNNKVKDLVAKLPVSGGTPSDY